MRVKKNIGWGIILLVLIIYISKETLWFGTNINKSIVMFRNIFMLLLFPFSYVMYQNAKRFNNHFDNKGFLIIGLLSFLVLLSGVLGSGGLEVAYFIKVTMLFTGLFIARTIKKEQFLLNFEKIVVFVATISIIVYLINILFPGVIRAFPLITNTSMQGYYNLFVTTIPNDDYNRLFGPFREPGVYMIFLNLALFIHIVTNPTISIVKTAILISTILLSKSTAGYFVLLTVVSLFLYKSRQIKASNKIMIFLILGSLLFGIFQYTDLLAKDGEVFNKFSVTGSDSYVSRFGSIYANVAIAKDNPLFGVGLNGIIELFPRYCLQTMGFVSEFNTNTLLMQFSIHGVLYGLVFCYFFFRSLTEFAWDRISTIIIIVFGFLLFSGENLCDNYLIYILFGYGLTNLVSKKNEYT